MLEEYEEGCSDSDNATVTEEHCLKGTVSDEDLEGDVEQQPPEGLLEESREDHGTIHNPNRYGSANVQHAWY